MSICEFSELMLYRVRLTVMLAMLENTTEVFDKAISFLGESFISLQKVRFVFHTPVSFGTLNHYPQCHQSYHQEILTS